MTAAAKPRSETRAVTSRSTRSKPATVTALPAALPRILLGGTYLHVPTGEHVEVLDFELHRKPPRRPKHVSARTGRYIVRPASSRAAEPFLTREQELEAAAPSNAVR